jgi:hypothetical protein
VAVVARAGVERDRDEGVQVVGYAGLHLPRAAQPAGVVRCRSHLAGLGARPAPGERGVQQGGHAAGVPGGGLGSVGAAEPVHGGVDGEPGHLDLAVRGAQDVLGGQAEVGQPLLVCGLQRARHLQRQVTGLVGRQHPALQQRGEVGRRHPLAHHVDHAVGLVGVEHAQEPRIGDGGGPPGGAEHPLGTGVVPLQQADADGSVQQLVLGAPVGGVLGAPDLLVEPVAVDQPGARLERVGRGHDTPRFCTCQPDRGTGRPLRC